MRNFLTVDAKNAEILNASFSDPVNNLKISEFHVGNPFADKTSQRILKIIFKYCKHPSFINNVTNDLKFWFLCVNVDDAFKETRKPQKTKVMKFFYIF